MIYNVIALKQSLHNTHTTMYSLKKDTAKMLIFAIAIAFAGVQDIL